MRRNPGKKEGSCLPDWGDAEEVGEIGDLSSNYVVHRGVSDMSGARDSWRGQGVIIASESSDICKVRFYPECNGEIL